MKSINEHSIVSALSKELHIQIESICAEEAKKAGEATERRVRAKVGEMVGNVSSYFSYERFGTELRITVRFPKGDEPTHQL